MPRLDWRFLLPAGQGAFGHLVLLGGTATLAERIVESGLAHRVSTTSPAVGSAEAVIVFSGAGLPLAAAARGLKPGGALYYEVDRRSPATVAASPGRLAGQLRRAGLTPTGVYWAAPDFADCRRYIPLDVPGAFQWYLSTLFVAGTPLHRLLEIGMRLYLHVGHDRLTAIAPCYAATAVAGTPSTPAPLALTQLAWPHQPAGAAQHPIVLTSGHDAGSRAVILPFASGQRQPKMVFKVAAHADLRPNTEREQTVLTDVRARLKGAMRETIPRPLGLLRHSDLTVSIESCASGKPLLVTSGRWHARFEQQLDDLCLAARWLSAFHEQVQGGRPSWDGQACERWIEGPQGAYRETFGLTTSEAELFAAVRAQSAGLTGTTLPLVWMHYDFGPWNLYRDKQAITVIDWEFGRNWERDRFGPALYDLLYFVTYWNHVVRHLNTTAEELLGLYKVFIAPGPGDRHAGAVRQVVNEYMARLDIDRRFLPVLLVSMWVEQALHQADRKQALGEAPADGRAHNRCVQYLGVLAEHADQLFARWAYVA